MNLNKPFFSVIVPICNTEPFLKMCLESVINQEFENFECIVINDGSPNKFNHSQTVEQIYKDVVGVDNRFKYIEQKNQGVAVARNSGFEVAVGEFIVFLDSDDLFHREHLTKLHWSLTNISQSVWLSHIFFQKDLMPFQTNSDGKIELLPNRQPVIEQRSKTQTNFLKELVYFSISEPMLIINRNLLGKARMLEGMQGGEGPSLINQIILRERENGREVRYCQLPLTQTYLYRLSETSFTRESQYKLTESQNCIILYNQIISHKLTTKQEKLIARIAILRYKLNVYNNPFAKIPKKLLTLISKILVKY